MALRRAYWGLHRKTDAGLEPFGVTAHQYVLLELLDQHGPSKQSELVRLASSDPNTIRAMVVTMCKQNLLERIKHPTDGRAWLVKLSDHAETLMPQLRERCQGIRDRYSATFDSNQKVQFLELLQGFAEAIQS